MTNDMMDIIKNAVLKAVVEVIVEMIILVWRRLRV
jgi:hypothetical protein